jgi:hypothetical protein
MDRRKTNTYDCQAGPVPLDSTDWVAQRPETALAVHFENDDGQKTVKEKDRTRATAVNDPLLTWRHVPPTLTYIEIEIVLLMIRLTICCLWRMKLFF